MNCPACLPSPLQSNSHTSSLHIGDGYWACAECSFGSVSLNSALSHCFAEGHRPRGLRNRQRESIFRFLAACEILSSGHDQVDYKRCNKGEANFAVALSPPKNNSRKLLPEKKTKDMNARETDQVVSVFSPTKLKSPEPRSISRQTNWTRQTPFEANPLIADVTPVNRTSPSRKWQQITEDKTPTTEVDLPVVTVSPIKTNGPQHFQLSKQMDWLRQTARETDWPFAAEPEPETNLTSSENVLPRSVLPRTEFDQENNTSSWNNGVINELPDRHSIIKASNIIEPSLDPLPLDSALKMTVNTAGTKQNKNEQAVNKITCPREKRTSKRIRPSHQTGKGRTDPNHVFGGMSEQEYAEIVAFLSNETYPDPVEYRHNFRKKCRQFVLDKYSLDKNHILLYVSKNTNKKRKVLKIGEVDSTVQAIHAENRHCRYSLLFTHVADRVWWPNTMHVDIWAVLNNCDVCGKSKKVSGEIEIEYYALTDDGSRN